MQTPDSIQAILDRCAYPGFSFLFDPEYPRVRVHCANGVCNETGAPVSWNGRWWVLSYHMVDGEIVQTLFLAIRTVLEHEARENFKFDDLCVFNSHIDIHKLAELRKQPDAIKERDPIKQ